MTFVEFFDKTASENIGACLTCVPDRVIFIGNNSKLMKKHIANYEKVFTERGHNIEFIFKTISKSNLENAVELLSEIVETYEDCVFDTTGGDEILILALGIVYSKHPNKNIQIHKINLRNNSVYDFDKDGITIFKETPKLSIEENIKIYGGEVEYGAIDEEKTYKWDLTPDFLDDISLIWHICKGNVRYWNMQIGIFEAAEIVGSVSEDALTTVVSRVALDRYLEKHKIKYKKAKGIVNFLLKYGLLIYFDDEDETTITISYKNEQVKKCLTKAGQALEMKVYITAKDALDKDGEFVYSDALNGVVIDWDGEFHDEVVEDVYDTKNEIDVLLMHNSIPIFISCKNGIVTSDELYKLETVAKRFGGRYAKKILIATSVDSLGEAGKYLRQRAKDMDIRLVENIQNMDDSEISRIIRSFWSN